MAGWITCSQAARTSTCWSSIRRCTPIPGGQQSKATPTAATAKFASAGKAGAKKDLGLMAMAYGHVYVAQVAMGAKCGLEHQKLAAESGYWPLYRYDPRRTAAGEHPLVIDSAHPKADVTRLLGAEGRFQLTAQQDPERYHVLTANIQQQITRRIALYEALAAHG